MDYEVETLGDTLVVKDSNVIQLRDGFLQFYCKGEESPVALISAALIKTVLRVEPKCDE